MIHHFARALAVRENRTAATGSSAPVQQSLFWPSISSTETEQSPGAIKPHTTARATAMAHHPLASSARVRRDPSDGRRALISGRFADVCAALDRMVGEFEPV